MGMVATADKPLSNALFDKVTKAGQTSLREGFAYVTGAVSQCYVYIGGSDTGLVHVPILIHIVDFSMLSTHIHINAIPPIPSDIVFHIFADSFNNVYVEGPDMLFNDV